MEAFLDFLTGLFRFFQDTNFVVAAYELLICTALLRRRKHFLLRLLVFVPFIVLTNNALGIVGHFNRFFLIGGMQFGYLLCFAVSVLLVWFCFDEKITLVLYFCTAAYIVENMGSQIGNMLNLMFFNGSPSVTDYNDVRPLLYYCVREIIEIPIFIAVRFVFVGRYKRRFDFHVKPRSIFILEAFTLLIIVVLNWYGTMLGYMNFVSRLYAMLVDVMLLLFQFAVFSETRLEYEKDVTEGLLKIQARQQEQAKENTALINVKYHDLKRQIAALKLVGGDEDRANAIRELEEATAFFEGTIKTGNDALDVVLTEKSLLFKENDICFRFFADGKLIDFMSASDIYVLFSNALDNALESLVRADKDLREILLVIERKNDFVKITLKNYCGETLQFQDGMPVTTRDKNYHGYGTKSIKLIAEKYRGLVNMSQDGTEFLLKILFPIQDKREDDAPAHK